MAMSQKAITFCRYFNTCRANLNGMEAFLDKNSFSDEDKQAIAAQMSSGDILLPKEEDALERWESMRNHVKSTNDTASSLGLRT